MFGHREILHTLIGMGSAALAAAMSYLSKGTRFSSRAQYNEVLKKEKKRRRVMGWGWRVVLVVASEKQTEL